MVEGWVWQTFCGRSCLILDDSEVQLCEFVLPRFRGDGAVVTSSSDGCSYNKNYSVFVFEGAALVWGI